MPRKRTKPVCWEVILLKASPARFIGLVYAPHEAAARQQAFAEYSIRAADQKRILVRRFGDW